MAHLRITLDSGTNDTKAEAKAPVKTDAKPKVTTKITNKKRGLK
jgi:hypothetical protein